MEDPKRNDQENLEATSPDPEVSEKPQRRRFAVEYKLSILEETDRAAEPGEVGAVLRREGLHSSHLTNWRKQRREGTLQGLEPKKRGRKAKEKNPLADRVAKLEREKRRLQERLDQAELIIEVQKKVAAMLGNPIEDSGKSK